MKKTISAAGNTVVPAILALEQLGFTISAAEMGETFIATRDDETYSANDPITVLGLVKLIEMRSWNWSATDQEIDSRLERYGLG